MTDMQRFRRIQQLMSDIEAGHEMHTYFVRQGLQDPGPDWLISLLEKMYEEYETLIKGDDTQLEH